MWILITVVDKDISTEMFDCWHKAREQMEMEFESVKGGEIKERSAWANGEHEYYWKIVNMYESR